jgi:hypothetical protein
MKGERKYLVILGLLAVVLVCVQLFAPKPINWIPTYLPKDKDPFGAYVTDSLFTDFFGAPVNTNNLTVYEMANTIKSHHNLISISDEFDADEESVKVLLNKVDSGATAFISAYKFRGKLGDTLGIKTNDVYFSNLALFQDSDSSSLKFFQLPTEPNLTSTNWPTSVSFLVLIRCIHPPTLYLPMPGINRLPCVCRGARGNSYLIPHHWYLPIITCWKKKIMNMPHSCSPLFPKQQPGGPVIIKLVAWKINHPLDTYLVRSH